MSRRVGLLHVLGIMHGTSGAPAPVNTVAPAIPASAVIGTTLNVTPGTWTGATTLTYQWQRNTGSWVDIGGATSTAYTPVDADFGRALRVVETANGSVSANSNETGLTAEAPVQAVGAELLTNGDFSAWTGDNPNGWAVSGEVGSDPMVTQVASGGGPGTRAARLFSTASLIRISQGVLTSEAYYESNVLVSAISGALNIRLGTGNTATSSANGMRRFAGRSTGATLLLDHFAGDTTIDDASVKLLTLNTQLTSPSANMRVDFFYTLPGSPVVGDEVWSLLRVSDFAAGNYWLVWLRYTGARWDINLYSVATHTRTSRIAATNIGTTNGIRVNANGDSWTLSTTADNGDNWTQRGSTITNATYNTATGVNVLHTSSVTAGQLQYAPAT